MGASDLKETSLRPPSANSLDASTIAHSGTSSVMEKHDAVPREDAPSSTPSIEKETQIEERPESIPNNGVIAAAETAVEESKVQDSAVPQDDDDIEYPKSWKLLLITLALCLSVFCMALV